MQLQTNFGGGKTHSMLALYHLFGGRRARRTGGRRRGAGRGGREDAAQGSARRPGGQQDLARQPGHQARWHGGAHALGRARLPARRSERPSRASPRTTRRRPAPATCCASSSSNMAPASCSIDEWVAYARQLHDQSDLPAGGFETQFTFAQALTESAKLAKNCLLVVSLAGVRYGRLTACPGRRRRGRRHSRTGGARPPAQRRRTRGILMAAGDGRGGLRDRSTTPVRADRGRICSSSVT